MKTLTELLQEAIRQSGKSAYQLAIDAGIGRPQITRFLHGERSIQLDTADKLLAALGCSVYLKCGRPAAKRKKG